MKTVYRVFSQGCIITTLMTLCFSVFLKASNVLTQPAMKLSQYCLILCFSFAIAVANLLLGLRGLHKLIRISVHYAVLLVAFFVIFILSSKIQGLTQAQTFIFFFVFTVLYAVIFALVFLAKKLLGKLSPTDSDTIGSSRKTDSYTSLYH